MPAKHYVLHLQCVDREEDDRLRRDVVRRKHVGDVAVDEHVARLQAQDGGLGDAGVGAADPEDLRGLRVGEAAEEVGILAGRGLTPGFVAAEGGLEGIWRGSGLGQRVQTGEGMEGDDDTRTKFRERREFDESRVRRCSGSKRKAWPWEWKFG